MNRRYSFFRITMAALAAFFSLPFIAHASITPSLSPSRTTGVAPLAVFFDASSTTASTTTLPFHELDYSWNFGDTGAGVWTYGIASTSKNIAHGPEAAHVFETPGIYTVTLSVYDGTETSTTQQLITVTDPDVVFAGTNTICISATGLPVAGSGGCPSGASVQTTGTLAEIISYATTGKRVLLKRGDTWTADVKSTLDVNGPGIIGAYGTGAKPIIHETGNNTILELSGQLTPNIGDWRIMDIEISGVNSAGLNSVGIVGGGNVNQITLLRLTFFDLYQAMSFAPSVVYGYNQSLFDDISITDSEFDHTPGSTGTFVAGYIGASRLSFMGNMGDRTTDTHLFRFPQVIKGVISNNTLSRSSADRHVIKLHAPTQGALFGGVYTAPSYLSEQVVISENFLTGSSAWTVSIEPQNAQSDERVRDVIVERNLFKAGAGVTQRSLIMSGQRFTVRNNIQDMTGGLAFKCTEIGQRGVEPAPSDFSFYNNTCYNGASSSNVTAVVIDTTTTNAIVKNNIASVPSGTVTMVSGTGGGLVQSNNLSNTSPSALFSSATPSALGDFVIKAGSAAVGAGVSVLGGFRDMYNNLRSVPPDIGAFNVDSSPVDIIPPTILSLNSNKNDGTYGVGEVIDIDVVFSEEVTSTGSVVITLETGTTDRTCTFAISNSDTGTCNYTVQSGDTTGDLSVSSITGTIADQSGNPMTDFVPGIALETNKALIIDTTPPTLTESSAIATGTDTTPDYTFSTTEAGSLTYGGDCTSSTTSATSGSNTITFAALSVGTHTNCTIQVTDASTNASTPLAVTSFTITTPTVTVSSSSSSSSHKKKKKKKKKKKISSKITYK